MSSDTAQQTFDLSKTAYCKNITDKKTFSFAAAVPVSTGSTTAKTGPIYMNTKNDAGEEVLAFFYDPRDADTGTQSTRPLKVHQLQDVPETAVRSRAFGLFPAHEEAKSFFIMYGNQGELSTLKVEGDLPSLARNVYAFDVSSVDFRHQLITSLQKSCGPEWVKDATRLQCFY